MLSVHVDQCSYRDRFDGFRWTAEVFRSTKVDSEEQGRLQGDNLRPNGGAVRQIRRDCVFCQKSALNI